MENIGPSSAPHVLVIHNPVAGRRRRRRLKRFLAALHARGARIRVARTAAAGDARRLAGAAADYDLVVAAGGDGTVNEVIGGLDGNAVPIAFMPLGTANVLAWELGLSRRPERLAEAVLGGRVQDVRAGLANGQRFLLMASAGLDAWTVEALRTGLKRRWGAIAYLWTALAVLGRFPFPTYRVTVDGRPFEASTVIVARARRYGGPFVVAPQAGLPDGRLTAVMFTRRGIWNTLRYGIALGLGRLHRLPDVVVAQGDRVRIEGPAGDPVQGDGDLLTRLPVDIGLDDTPVRLVVPGPDATA